MTNNERLKVKGDKKRPLPGEGGGREWGYSGVYGYSVRSGISAQSAGKSLISSLRGWRRSLPH